MRDKIKENANAFFLWFFLQRQLFYKGIVVIARDLKRYIGKFEKFVEKRIVVSAIKQSLDIKEQVDHPSFNRGSWHER